MGSRSRVNHTDLLLQYFEDRVPDHDGQVFCKSILMIHKLNKHLIILFYRFYEATIYDMSSGIDNYIFYKCSGNPVIGAQPYLLQSILLLITVVDAEIMCRHIVNSRQTTASRFRHADLASRWFKYRVQALDREPFSEVYRYRYDPHTKQALARLIQFYDSKAYRCVLPLATVTIRTSSRQQTKESIIPIYGCNGLRILYKIAMARYSASLSLLSTN